MKEGIKKKMSKRRHAFGRGSPSLGCSPRNFLFFAFFAAAPATVIATGI